MSGHEGDSRLFSKETTKTGIRLGLVGGLIGLIAGIAALEVYGFGLAATGVIYDRLKNGGKKAGGKGGGHGGGHH